MCNLYRMTRTVDEVAGLFDAVNEAAGSNIGAEVYPGYPGLVVQGGRLRQMTWGFPLQMKGAKGQPLKPKPVNNTRTDKLGSFFWKSSFEARRCLIPLTGWAEAEGAKGTKTRTWLTIPDVPIFSAAALWRSSEEWGDVYSMVITDAAGPASGVHSRMPVFLQPADYPVWLTGEPEAAFELCRAWEGDVSIDRTDEPWARGAQPRLV